MSTCRSFCCHVLLPSSHPPDDNGLVWQMAHEHDTQGQTNPRPVPRQSSYSGHLSYQRNYSIFNGAPDRQYYWSDLKRLEKAKNVQNTSITVVTVVRFGLWTLSGVGKFFFKLACLLVCGGKEMVMVSSLTLWVLKYMALESARWYCRPSCA